VIVNDTQKRSERIIGWIRRRVQEAGAHGGVLGVSGGVDSSVVAALCVRAFGEKALGLILPCHSLPQDIEDAREVTRTLGLCTEEVDLSAVYDQLVRLLPPGQTLSRSNLKPRLRMLALYYYASVRNALVVGTSNRSELAVGYFTKYGDGGADILPIGGLLKGEVIALAHALEIPRRIIEKPPSAGLWQGQTDEEEMGITYENLDRFLSGGEVPPDVARRIHALMADSDHKRRHPPICIVTPDLS
jgi:NAD+ synthase